MYDPYPLSSNKWIFLPKSESQDRLGEVFISWYLRQPSSPKLAVYYLKDRPKRAHLSSWNKIQCLLPTYLVVTSRHLNEYKKLHLLDWLIWFLQQLRQTVRTPLVNIFRKTAFLKTPSQLPYTIPYEKFLSRVTTLLGNNALWLVKSGHLTYNIQS